MNILTQNILLPKRSIPSDLREYFEPAACEKCFICKMVEVFNEVRRVLKNNGTLWLNLGDSYWTDSPVRKSAKEAFSDTWDKSQTASNGGLRKTAKAFGPWKNKDLIGIPWRVAFALQEAGWWLRQDIIWSKPNPMPESVTDRCTKAHEYMFLLTKSAKYFYDAEAIKSPIQDVSVQRLMTESPVKFGGNNLCPDTRLQSGKEWMPKGWKGSSFNSEKTATHQQGRGQKDRDRSLSRNRNGITDSLDIKAYEHRGAGDQKLTGHSGNFDADGKLIGDGMANKKSVWTVTTQPFKDAHFATFPPKLIEPCILAGSREGDLILDPFCGASTTLIVALQHNRRAIGIELNPEYIEISKRRLKDIQVEMF